MAKGTRGWAVAVAVTLAGGLLMASPAHAARDINGTCAPVIDAPFPDVAANHVHAQAIDCLLEREITVGRDDGTYGSTAAVTHGQMATFLRRLLTAAGTTVPATTPPSDDVHSANLDDMIHAGVLPPGAAVTGPIRRDTMATWMSGAYEFSLGAPLWGAPLREPSPFTDIADSAPYRADVLQLRHVGVIAGVTADRYDPTGTVTRGQMASFLARLLDTLADGIDLPAWSSLTAEARQLLRESGDPIARWAPGPITLALEGDWSAGAAEAAAEFWNDMLHDLGTTIVVTTRPEDADVVFTIRSDRPSTAPSHSCGVEGPTNVDGSVISAGGGEYWPTASGCGRDQGNAFTWDRTATIHGLGHVLGLLAHTADGTDVMSTPNSTTTSSPTLDAVMRFIYSVPAGFRLPTGG